MAKRVPLLGAGTCKDESCPLCYYDDSPTPKRVKTMIWSPYCLNGEKCNICYKDEAVNTPPNTVTPTWDSFDGFSFATPWADMAPDVEEDDFLDDPRDEDEDTTAEDEFFTLFDDAWERYDNDVDYSEDEEQSVEYLRSAIDSALRDYDLRSGQYVGMPKASKAALQEAAVLLSLLYNKIED